MTAQKSKMPMREPADSQSDKELMALVSTGDRQSFDRLIDRHYAATFRFASSYTRNDASTEDVLQEAFLAAFVNAGSFRGDSSVRGWLFTIVRNKALRHIKPRAGEPKHFESLVELGVAAGWGNERPDVAIELSRRKQMLHAALRTLSKSDQAVIILRDLEGLTGPEAADVLDLTLANLKTRLHRARLRLLHALHDGGHNGS